jgi:hypothetical protein
MGDRVHKGKIEGEAQGRSGRQGVVCLRLCEVGLSASPESMSHSASIAAAIWLSPNMADPFEWRTLWGKLHSTLSPRYCTVPYSGKECLTIHSHQVLRRDPVGRCSLPFVQQFPCQHSTVMANPAILSKGFRGNGFGGLNGTDF